MTSHAAPEPAPAPKLAPAPSLAYDIEAPRTLGEQVSEAVGLFFGGVVTTLLNYQPVRDALRGIVAASLGQSAPPPTEETMTTFAHTPNPARKPRVLVAGLKGHQMEEIRKDLGERFLLKFWASGRSLDELRRAASEADITIGMTNFIGHPAEAVMRDRSPKYIRHSGGIANLKIRLHDLAAVVTHTTH